MVIRSDNEPSFLKMNKTLAIVLREYKAVLTKLHVDLGSNTKWIHNVPAAPWWGAFYERLIGTLKRAIDRTKLAASTSYEEVLTVLREAQHFLNSRPQVNRPEQQPLTPAHLVFGRSIGQVAPVKFPIKDRDDTLIAFSNLQSQLEKMWDLWLSEYLPALRVHQWPVRNGRKPRVNELVIIMEPGTPRFHWPLGRIVALHQGLDGVVRAAEVENVLGTVPSNVPSRRSCP